MGGPTTAQPDTGSGSPLRLFGHKATRSPTRSIRTRINQNSKDWNNLLQAELEHIAEARAAGGGTGELVVLTHSLGCVTWLKSAVEGLLPDEVKPDRLLLVAPAANEMLDPVADFKVDLSSAEAAERVLQSAATLTLVGSDRDVWTPQGVQHHFGEPLGLDARIILGAKHLALGDGWGAWQGVIDWVNDASADLTVR